MWYSDKMIQETTTSRQIYKLLSESGTYSNITQGLLFYFI